MYCNFALKLIPFHFLLKMRSYISLLLKIPAPTAAKTEKCTFIPLIQNQPINSSALVIRDKMSIFESQKIISSSPFEFDRKSKTNHIHMDTHYIHSVLVKDFVSGRACCVNQYHYEWR